MTFVVTEACIRCKHTDCVEPCPVDAFHEGENFLVICPEECIDCGLCVPACPVSAILADAEVSADQRHFIQLNQELSHRWPVITEKKDAPEDAEAWAGVTGKLDQLRR